MTHEGFSYNHNDAYKTDNKAFLFVRKKQLPKKLEEEGGGEEFNDTRHTLY